MYFLTLCFTFVKCVPRNIFSHLSVFNLFVLQACPAPVSAVGHEHVSVPVPFPVGGLRRGNRLGRRRFRGRGRRQRRRKGTKKGRSGRRRSSRNGHVKY